MDYRYNLLGNGVLNNKYRLRNCLRYCIWHHCKKVKRRCRVYLVLWQNQEMLDAGRIVGKEIGVIAQIPIMKTTITSARLRERGMSVCWKFMFNSIHNPVNRRVRDPYA